MATSNESRTTRPTPTQLRAARRARRQRRRRLIRWGGLAALGLVSFAFIAGLFLPSVVGLGGGGGGIFGGGAPEGPGQRIEDAGAVHISPGQEHAAYTSVPPTSGPHFGQPLAPTRWGIHNQQLQDEVLIHNLEHGGIGIFYDCPDGCPELVEQLSTVVNRGVNGGLKIIMAPYAGMSNRISLNAWTFLDQFDEFDEGRITDFIDAHESSSNAPEPLAR